jgi:alanine racemase
LAALRQNFRVVQRHVGGDVTICAVVKADAYGHGAVECARALEQQGADWLGVTSLDEAIPLRDAGIQTRILLMTGFWRGEEAEIIRLKLTPTIWETSQIECLNSAASAHNISNFPVHLKVDTGMGRLGVSIEDLPRLCHVLKSSTHLMLEGVSTHIASSEVLDALSVEQQLRTFTQARSVLRDAGFDPSLVHAANTGAVISRKEALHNMVRPGIALYGYYLPFEKGGKEVSNSQTNFDFVVRPVLQWKTRILSLRKMPANQALGYGGTYVTRAPSTIAVLPVGYADGLNRQLSSRGRVILRDHYAPIVGRISMDLTLVDVTAIPGTKVGDEVVLLGSSGELNVDAMEHARLAHTTPYEILCCISKRVPRKYSV